MSERTTALLLIAHGSRHARANADLEELAGALEASGPYAPVIASFLELADPDIAAGGAQCVTRGAGRVILLPYFLAAGVHVRRDLSAALEQLRRRFPEVGFDLAEPLGPHPKLAEIVLERAAQAGVAAETRRAQPESS